MKKIAWGMLLNMLETPVMLLVLLLGGLLPIRIAHYATLIGIGLTRAGGYFLLMRGCEELDRGGNIEWVRKISMVLSAYYVAETVLDVAGIMPNLGAVSTVLGYVVNLAGFLAVYMMVWAMVELQRFQRVELFARELQNWFTIYVISGFVGSLIGGLTLLAALVRLAASVVVVVYFFKAAKNYRPGGSYRVM